MAVDDGVITKKELFERLLTIENKVQFNTETNRKTEKRFLRYAVLILILEVFNLIVHTMGFLYGRK